MRQTALNMVYELAKKDPKVVFIGSDLGQGVLQQFKENIPDRFFMEGISEAHVVGMAAGMAMEGKIPYVNTIATFLTRRCFEQIVLDLALHNQNVRLISNGGGLVYAPLGPTHLAIDDIAILRTVPRMTIIAPADATEMSRVIPKTLNHQGPIYIRVAKGGDPVVTDPSMGFEIGRVYPMRSGSDALLISTGICLKLALEAADNLASKGIHCSVLHVPTVKPLDKKMIMEFASPSPVVVTIEEGVIDGGLGSAVAETILEHGVSNPKSFKRMGIPDVFPDQYGSQESLMTRCGISTSLIVDAVLEFHSRSAG